MTVTPIDPEAQFFPDLTTANPNLGLDRPLCLYGCPVSLCTGGVKGGPPRAIPHLHRCVMIARHDQPPRTRRGTHAVEFAVALPVFLIFLWGMIDVGRGFMISSILT